MPYFPGNIMVIDDQYNLVYADEPVDLDKKVQYKSLISIKSFCEDNGIPLISISDTSDAASVKAKMEAYSNVRMLIIDLDLNDDGSVNPEDDYVLIYKILEIALKKYGYFLLLINSANAEAWNGVKESMPEGINMKLIENLTHIYDKNTNEPIYEALEKIGKNYSAEIVYDFEVLLNRARDKAFSNFLDFEKDSWKKIHQVLSNESGEIAHNDISTIMLSIIKQHLLEGKYPKVTPEENIESSPEMRKLVYRTINYSFNKENVFDKQKIWTGNLYQTNLSNDRRYALVITPECDIAQNKHFYYKLSFGFHIDEDSLPADYNPALFTDDILPPLFPHRAGKNNKAQWRKKSDLDDWVKKHTAPSHHFYPLPFINDHLIYIDFRDVMSIKPKDLENEKWELLLRINDPMITNIIDSYSNLHNRKGLLPL